MGTYEEFYETRAAEAEAEAQEACLYPDRTPLTTNQHILHLILTLVTCGLWGIVWIVRAVQGNRETYHY